MPPSTKLIPYYDDPSYEYPRYWQGRKYEDQADKLALKKLLEVIGPKETLLDIGGGFGRLLPVYEPYFAKITLLDSSQKMLNEAKKRFMRKNLVLIKSFAEKLPFPDKSFDLALMVRTFHHLENPEKAIAETNRILKEDGFLILEFANKLHLKARLRAILRFDFGYLASLQPLSVGKKKAKTIPFLNYPPQAIKNILEKNGFKVYKTLSVSGFRSPFLKRLFPLKVLVFLENLNQKYMSGFYSGPSIFLMAKKSAI